MTETNELHVVGGSGAISRVVVRELATRGKRARAVNRSGHVTVPEGAGSVAVDATDPASVRNAPFPQVGRAVPMMEAVIEGAAAAAAAAASSSSSSSVESVLGRNLFGLAPKGRKARFIGDSDVPLTPTFIEDFAREIVALGEREEALGEVWHVPTAEPTPGGSCPHDLRGVRRGRQRRRGGKQGGESTRPVAPGARGGGEDRL